MNLVNKFFSESKLLKNINEKFSFNPVKGVS